MSCRWSGRMNSSECPCQPHTEARQAKHDAFLRQFEDSKAVMKNVADKYPDGTTSTDLRDLELLGTGKPPFRAGSFSDDLDFDGMVKEARYRLFGRSDGRPLDNVNHPVFGDALTQAEVWEASFVKFLFEYYRNGLCLNCTSRIEHAGCDGEPGKEGQRILRSLLGMFDRTGEPIPRELREWSAASRFQEPPPRGGGTPGQNWLRDRYIIHTVATLAYLTGRHPTRSDASEDESPCDAVAPGSAMLERWREQDREEA